MYYYKIIWLAFDLRMSVHVPLALALRRCNVRHKLYMAAIRYVHHPHPHVRDDRLCHA